MECSRPFIFLLAIPTWILVNSQSEKDHKQLNSTTLSPTSDSLNRSTRLAGESNHADPTTSGNVVKHSSQTTNVHGSNHTESNASGNGSNHRSQNSNVHDSNYSKSNTSVSGHDHSSLNTNFNGSNHSKSNTSILCSSYSILNVNTNVSNHVGTNVSTNAPSGRIKTFLEIYSILDLIMFGVSIIGIIANSFLILVVCFDPLKRLRKAKSTVIVVNLALADLLTSWVTAVYAYPSKDKLYPFNYFWLGYCASFLILLAFTLERFFATLYPFKAKQLVTYEKTLIACIASWAVAVVLGNDGFYSKQDIVFEFMRILKVGILELVVFAMVFLNICMIKSLRKHARAVRQGRWTSGYVKKQMELNVVLTILVVMLILTVFPHLLSYQLYHVSRWCTMSTYKCFLVDDEILFNITMFPKLFLPFGILNFVLNPIIYAWRLEDYRKSAIALFSRGRKLKRDSSLPFANGTYQDKT